MPVNLAVLLTMYPNFVQPGIFFTAAAGAVPTAGAVCAAPGAVAAGSPAFSVAWPAFCGTNCLVSPFNPAFKPWTKSLFRETKLTPAAAAATPAPIPKPHFAPVIALLLLKSPLRSKP